MTRPQDVVPQPVYGESVVVHALSGHHMGENRLAERVLRHQDLQQDVFLRDLLSVRALTAQHCPSPRNDQVVEANDRHGALGFASVRFANTTSHDAVLTPASVRRVVLAMPLDFFLSWIARVWSAALRGSVFFRLLAKCDDLPFADVDVLVLCAVDHCIVQHQGILRQHPPETAHRTCPVKAGAYGLSFSLRF